MTELEMNEWFAMNGKWNPDYSVETLYQAFKARLASESTLNIFGEKK